MPRSAGTAEGTRTARAVALGAVVLTAGCGIFVVDHDANAERFCDRTAELLEPAAVDDGTTFTEDQAKYLSDQLSKNMRYAEDATRDLRRRARDLADSYDEARDLAGVDDAPADEVEDLYEDLRDHRDEMRAACADLTPAEEPEAP